MSSHSIAYIVFATTLLIYSIRNRLDLLCVASVCYIVYSIYCIPGIGISGLYRPKLSPQLYAAVYVQLSIIIIFVMYSRYRMRSREKLGASEINKRNKKKKEKTIMLSFRVYTFIIAVFALMNIVSVGLSGFMAGKSLVWEKTNVFYIISLYGAWPSFAYGIHKNDKLIWIVSLLIELTIFFAGSRAFTATVIIIFLCEKGTVLWKNRKNYVWIYILGAIGIVFLLLYRMVDTQIMAGDVVGVINTLKDPQTWMTAFEFNEPRVIIANYDYSFTSGIRLPYVDVVYRIIDFVPGLTGLTGIKPQYPDYYSTWLMEQVQGSAGVGGSIWGECYAMAGFIGIIIGTIIWLFFVNKCNNHLDYHDGYSYFSVALGTYLAWYINRLDFNRVAQSFKVMLFCFLIWAVINLMFSGNISIGKFQIIIRNTSSHNIT